MENLCQVLSDGEMTCSSSSTVPGIASTCGDDEADQELDSALFELAELSGVSTTTDAPWIV